MNQVERGPWPQLKPAIVAGPWTPLEEAWKIIVVSSEQVWFEAISQALPSGLVDGRPLEILQAASEDEARSILGYFDAVLLPLAASSTGNAVKVYLAADAEWSCPSISPRRLFALLIETVLRTEKLMECLRAQRFLDPLCQLPNRPLFLHQLEGALREHREWVVAVVDIDHFSSITNALGYPLGDALLRAVAAKLQNALRPRGYRLGRIGNDSFALLAPQGTFDPAQVFSLFEEPMTVHDYPLHVSLTMGLVRVRDVHGGAEGVLKCATTALKTGKHQMRGACRCFVPTMATEVEERVQLAHDLKAALAQGMGDDSGLSVHYQPQVDLADGRPVGVEALVRWRHPTLGMVMPDRFIYIAEQAGLIVDLGELVLERACRDQMEWLAQGIPPLRVAVNVSMQQFRSARFLPSMQRILAQTGIAPEHLELEITESMLMGDAPAVIHTLKAVKALGITVAMDDFGTGYSSLSHLRTLPIDRLKVDRSFVRDIEEGNDGAKIAEMIVSLGQTLGKEVVAEGIEQACVIDTLQSWGCREGQGYYYARPMQKAALSDWLRQRAAVGDRQS